MISLSSTSTRTMTDREMALLDRVLHGSVNHCLLG